MIEIYFQHLAMSSFFVDYPFTWLGCPPNQPKTAFYLSRKSILYTYTNTWRMSRIWFKKLTASVTACISGSTAGGPGSCIRSARSPTSTARLSKRRCWNMEICNVEYLQISKRTFVNIDTLNIMKDMIITKSIR